MRCVIHHAQRLAAQPTPQYGRAALRQRSLINIKFIGVHLALHHCFTQAISRRDEHHLIKTGFGVDGEHHTGRAAVTAHHTLHRRRQRHLGMRIIFVHTVRNSTVVIKRGKHLLDRIQQIVEAAHIEKGFLLPGERGIGQVFRRCR